MDLNLKMTAQDVEDLIQRGFSSKHPFLKVESLEPGRIRIRIPYRDSMLRPGNILSGPALFTAADIAMYALVLTHVGPQLMAVTSNLNMNFINKGAPGDILADCRLLKLGRRNVVMEVSLYSAAAPDTLITHVTGSYALPMI